MLKFKGKNKTKTAVLCGHLRNVNDWESPDLYVPGSAGPSPRSGRFPALYVIVRPN